MLHKNISGHLRVLGGWGQLLSGGKVTISWDLCKVQKISHINLTAYRFDPCHTSKGRFISEIFNNFDHLNHYWPKIPAHLNSFLCAKERIQIGWCGGSTPISTEPWNYQKYFQRPLTQKYILIFTQDHIFKLDFEFWRAIWKNQPII